MSYVDNMSYVNKIRCVNNMSQDMSYKRYMSIFLNLRQQKYKN